VLAKDKEFIAWRAEHPESYVSARAPREEAEAVRDQCTTRVADAVHTRHGVRGRLEIRNRSGTAEDMMRRIVAARGLLALMVAVGVGCGDCTRTQYRSTTRSSD
jgi:hypothetical protein